MYTRRKFIKTAATGLALTAITGNLAGCNAASSFGSTIKEFGLQLYSLRDVIANDPKGILKQVAEMGYKQIESYKHEELGIYWGMKNTEFKKYMDSLGMQLIGSHCTADAGFEKNAAEAAEIGMKYLILGSIEKETEMNKDGYKKAADLLNKKGEICKSHGIRFAYHNHADTFVHRTEGFIPQKILLENTDPGLVDFEMDIYWVVTASEDPIKWFEEYPDRFLLSHIKDRKKNAPLSDTDASCILGEGEIDFSKILNAGEKMGLEYFIVEQERYDNTTPLNAIRENALYLKKLKI